MIDTVKKNKVYYNICIKLDGTSVFKNNVNKCYCITDVTNVGDGVTICDQKKNLNKIQMRSRPNMLSQYCLSRTIL